MRHIRGVRAAAAAVRPFSHQIHSYAIPTKPVVSDQDIARLAAQPRHPLTLRDLVRHGRSPLSQSSLYDTANFALSILPTRLAHRIQSLRNLPYIVVTNPNISSIHDNYMHSLAMILPFAESKINTVDDEAKFVDILEGIVQTHSSTIPILAKGFLETRRYIAPAAVTKFLDEHLRARIGTRMIAEQQIALHNHSREQDRGSIQQADDPYNSYIGIIDTALKPAAIVRSCEAFVSDICELKYGVRPTIIINGQPETTIAHVPVHLEYILTELLKNAFRATIERGNERNPIEVTIAPAPEDSPASTKGISTKDQGETSCSDPNMQPLENATPGVTIRIRDQGGGITSDNLKNIWSYSFTTYDEAEAVNVSSGLDLLSASGTGGSTLAGLGYGLPLSRAYAEYFGGGITLHSLEGWGTDVYVSLRGVGKVD